MGVYHYVRRVLNGNRKQIAGWVQLSSACVAGLVDRGDGEEGRDDRTLM